MRIAQTRFRNFRNLENTLIDWGPGLNVLTGANAAGKTNVLEALHILTGWGTFAGSRLSDTVQWDSAGGASLAAQVSGEREAVIDLTIVRAVACVSAFRHGASGRVARSAAAFS